nr:MAG: polyprotein 1 [Picornavirales sp.]
MIMSEHTKVSHAGSDTQNVATVLPTPVEITGPLDSQSGQDNKQFAQSKYAKQKRWKDKNGDNKDKRAKQRIFSKVRKDAQNDRTKLGPQAGIEGFVETVSEDGSVHSTHEEHTHSEEYDKYYFMKRLAGKAVSAGKVDQVVKNFKCNKAKSDVEEQEKGQYLQKVWDRNYQDPFCEIKLLFRQMGVKEDEKILGIFENIGVLYVKLSRDKTWLDVSTTLFLYAKTHTQRSAITLVYECLKSAFYNIETELEPQAGVPAPSWLTKLRDANMNWALIRNNPAFSKITKLLSICVALGLCEITLCGFDMSSMDMFAKSASKTQYGAADLISAAMSTFVHFMECGYLCFATRSWKPLLYGDLDTQRFNDLYQKCMLNIEYHRCGNLFNFSGLHEVDFAKDLDECLRLSENLSRLSVGSYEKASFLRYRDKIVGWKADFEQSRMTGGLRVAPYTIGIFGQTAVGKSSLANILMVYVLKSNGFDASDDRLVTINEADKYDSNMRSSVTGVFIDDLGNTKEKYVTEAPTAKLIRYCNNVKNYAVMASVEQKGKVAIEPKVVVITKNVKDSCATVYSNEPTSITRREHITLTVTVRPEFATGDMLDPVKVQRMNLHTDPIPDLWLITVERTKLIKSAVLGRSPAIGWEIVDNMVDVSVYTLIRWLKSNTAKYYNSQNALVAVSGKLSEKMTLCQYCSLPTKMCTCQVHLAATLIQKWARKHTKLHSQAGLSVAHLRQAYSAYSGTQRIINSARTATRTWLPIAHVAVQGVDRVLQTRMHERLRWIEQHWYIRIWAMLPSGFIDVDAMTNLLLFQHLVSNPYVLTSIYAILFTCIFWIVYLSFSVPQIILTVFIPIYLLCVSLAIERRVLYDRLLSERTHVELITSQFRESHVFKVGSMCAGLVTIYYLARMVISMRSLNKDGQSVMQKLAHEIYPQGALDPDSEDEIEMRDLQQNVWAVPKVTPRPVSQKMRTTTSQQLCDKVFKNLVHVTITNSSGKKFTTNAFFLCSNMMLLPNHVMVEDELHANILRNDSPGGKFQCILSREYSYKIPTQDLCVMWVPNGGDWVDLTDYLNIERPRDTIARFVHKDAHGARKDSKIFCTVDEQRSVSHGPFQGARYHLEFPTFKGLCMSVVTTDGKFPGIYGFHVAGKDGTTLGCCACPIKSELECAIMEVCKIPGVIKSMSSGTLEDTVLGVQYYEGESIHVKSPLNFIPEGTDSTFVAYGSVIGRAKYYSEVVPTPISKIVEEVCGVPQQWGKPQFGTGYPWQKALVKRVTPSCGVEGVFLKWAVTDYSATLITRIRDFKNLVKEIVPLTREETVNGIIGKRFIDKMPGNTSIGFPFTGPKSQYYVEVPVPDDPTRQECVDLPPEFWTEVERIEEIYLSKEERGYPILKACLKDEPTLLTKDKVRDFLALPVSFQLLVRKYFLPIARVMSMLPLYSECAVGINAHGPEWQELHEYVTQYGSDRILAGDYKAYDLKMPAQLSQAAFSVFINVATAFGYNKEQLCIMRGIATDLTYPTVAYNGDLIGFHNTNPSGHNLTVYINCVVNSLLLRCAFCASYGVHKTIRFREVCALMTYGDDCMSSVNPLYPDFNHCTVARYLSDRGMEFTMPDKTSDPIPYLSIETCDFLKRKSVFHPALKLHLGALDEMSIFKSLHSVLRSTSVTTEEQSIMNIDGAVREFFAHGKDQYEVRRAQMIEIAKRSGLEHACKELYFTYEDRIGKWREQYESTDG